MDLKKAHERLKDIVNTHIIRKPVILASGKPSNYYFDGKEVSLTAEGSTLNARLMFEKIRNDNFDAIGGMTLGADPIIGALLPVCFENGKQVTGFIVRKELKEHGRGKMVEGPEMPKGARVVLIEDVVTTGGSVLKVVQTLRELYDAKVVKVITLVNREEGGEETLAKEGIKLDWVFCKSDFPGLD